MDDKEFSNYDKDVFVLNMVRQLDRGALMSRYSRTRELDIRKVWEREFKNNPDRSDKFYERIFVEYGDESIAELVNAQVGIQNVSNIASKLIEESRIGLSYIEKSSRYVSYGEKSNGRYLYLSPENVGLPASLFSLYEETCDFLFDSYNEILESLNEELKRKYPVENMKFEISGKEMNYDEAKSEVGDAISKAYQAAVRSRALDEARYLLPASTLTNVGTSGNARAYIRLIYRLLSSGLPEAIRIGQELKKELTPVFSRLMNTLEREYGIQELDYESAITSNFNYDDYNGSFEEVQLVEFPDDKIALNNLVIPYIFQRSYLGYADIIQRLNDGTIDPQKIVRDIANLRKNRRNKVGREAEYITYKLVVATNFGAFRELQRHRTLTIVRKPPSTHFGYQIPPTIFEDEKMMNLFQESMKKSSYAYQKIKAESPSLAQYVVTFAHIYPVFITANLRELIYLTELRSTSQAHFDLRRVSQVIFDKISQVNPTIAPLFKFVDHKDYPLGRMRAEIRKEKKMMDLSKA